MPMNLGLGLGLSRRAGTGEPAPGPINSVAPVVSGTPEIGEELTTTDGSWTGTGTITYAYQWLRDGSNISGAEANTYTLVSGDDLTTVSCRVTATDDDGSRSAVSNGLAVTYPEPVNTVAPAVTGTTAIGDTLTSDTGTWTGGGLSYSYQWQRDTVDIDGATSSTYELVLADDGASIRCVVTATNSGGAVSENSNAVTAGAVFDPADLSPTAWFRPNDASTVFSADYPSTAAAVDATVSLALGLDAGNTLGSELITNGTFDTDLSGWTIGSDGAGWSVSSGRAYFNDTERAGNQFIRQTLSTTSGLAHRISYDYEVNAGQAQLTIPQGANVFQRYLTGSGSRNGFLFLTSASPVLDIGPENVNALCQFYFDNVSIRSHPSRYARQTTAGDRPTYREGGNGVRYFESVSSDTLNWTAPAGTYTVAYVIPDGTVTILTSQSLSGATNIMLASQIVEYIAVNRSLTTEETAGITAYLEGIANP